jgi:hypothetical protein
LDTYKKTLEKYENLVAAFPDIERKGKTMPYTSVNGHMFSLLTKEGQLAIRLPKDELTKFLEKHDTQLCEQYGKVMKEYAIVPDSLLGNTRSMKKYFTMSYDYVSSLKPK